MNRFKIVLIGIVLLAAVLRFWQIGANPPSLNWDEAAWGYNAYSLGINGRDEFGVFLPYKYLESYGDYKPPVYAYLDILPVKILGLNEFATRFPSALLGTLTVLLTYFLVKKLFEEETHSEASGQAGKSSRFTVHGSQLEITALLATFFLAISPWHINLSRAAYEANVATFFLVFGIFAFLEGVSKRKWFIILSAISFAITFYTFNTSRVFAPLIVGVLVIGCYKKLWNMKKEVITAAVVGAAMILPIAGFLLSPQAAVRFDEVNIFTDGSIVKMSNQEIANEGNSILSKIIYNRRFLYGTDFLKHYLDNFNPLFLFINGDVNARFSTRDVGEMYIWDIPFFVLGIFLLFKTRRGYWWVIPFWMILGIIPAATARETPHALRIETTLPTFQILTAISASCVLVWIASQKIKWKKTIIGVISFLLLFNFIYYLHGYYGFYPIDSSRDWQYGYKDLVSYVDSIQNNYDQIDITTALGRPYIYFLFYNKTVPSDYLKTAQVRRDVFGFVHIDGFGKYKFQDKLLPVPGKNILYVETPDKIPSSAHVVKKFNVLDGSEELIAYTM